MDESELVMKAGTGDVDAFTELVRRYQAMAFGYAYSRIGDFHLAEDTAQQAFIAAWRGLPGLRQPERFGGWLRSIVRFECSHLLRAQRPQMPLEDAAKVIDTDEPARLAEERDELDRVITAVNGLPEAEREVTILYYIHDHSQREVAAFLNLPITTVNNRLRTARKRFKEGWLLAMANDAFKEHRLPNEFASRIGEIVRLQGPIVDARFTPEQRPRVLNALTVDNGTSGPTVTVEAIQHLDDGLVRGIAVANTNVQFRTGAQIVDTGGPVTIPLERAAIDQVIASLRPTSATAEIVETGIKIIDLLCPLPKQGRVALIGDMHSGKMVLVEELIQRLADTSSEISILVFVETPDEAAVVNGLEYRTSANVAAIYLPVADPGPESLSEVTTGLDTVITLSQQLAGTNLYPAIDPVRSTSRLLAGDVANTEHLETARRVREVLASDNDARAERVRSFLTQPFFVAEEHTNRPGQHVSLSETIRDCTALLEGNHDGLSTDDLYMIGSLEDALDNPR